VMLEWKSDGRRGKVMCHLRKDGDLKKEMI